MCERRRPPPPRYSIHLSAKEFSQRRFLGISENIGCLRDITFDKQDVKFVALAGGNNFSFSFFSFFFFFFFFFSSNKINRYIFINDY
ncbi:hypothetical protein PUN28_013056 [Cardiocondyla obscurior]|uniref:Uncharacterized protein n=1 Tax=Cardiocondyla obscurior TaxID=286306 RepID=A0AAW2F9R4_9HYME